MVNPEAKADSTPTDDSVPMENSQTEEALLADIIRNSDFVDTLPEEQVPELDADNSEDEDPDSDLDDSEEVEEEVEEQEEDTEEKDDNESTPDTDVYTPDDLDLDAQVLVKIDGEEKAVTFSDLIKGYSTEQHLSQKGRELGDARKKIEEDYKAKLSEIENVSKASAAVLYSGEQSLAKEYHELESQIEKAREEGDTYEVNELKDKREQVQKQYWDARKHREGMVQSIQKREQEAIAQNWQEQLQNFQESIPTMIPDFDEKVAMSIREFAIEEGISPEILDTVADPTIIKFVDDYRRLKQGITKGSVKRKATANKQLPTKKAKSNAKKKESAAAEIRRKGLDPDSSQEDQMAFLKSMASRSLNSI